MSLSIKQSIEYTVECCSCGYVSELTNGDVNSEGDAERLFEMDGWEEVNGQTYCYECAITEKEKFGGL